MNFAITISNKNEFPRYNIWLIKRLIKLSTIIQFPTLYVEFRFFLRENNFWCVCVCGVGSIIMMLIFPRIVWTCLLILENCEGMLGRGPLERERYCESSISLEGDCVIDRV